MISRLSYKTILFCILLIAFCTKSIAQTKLFEDRELNTIHNYRIMQDHFGFIWMIGEKGIAKYDGTNSRTFTTKEGLPTNDIWNIRITDDDKIWYFSSAKEHGYILNNVVYNFPAQDSNIDMKPKNIVQKENNVGFYNANGQYVELVDGKWTVKNNFEKEKVFYLNSDYCKSIYYKQDSIFIRTNKNETRFISKKGELTTYFSIYPNELLFLFVDNNIKTINLKTLIISDLDLTKYNLNLKHKIAVSYQNNNFQLTGNNFVLELDSNLNIHNVNCIKNEFESFYSMIDRLGNLWIVSFNNGIYFMSYPETKSKTYDIGSTKELKVINDKIHFITKKKYFGRIENEKTQVKFTNLNESDIYSYFSLKDSIYLFINNTIVLDSHYVPIKINKLWNAKSIVKIKDHYYVSHHYNSEILDSNLNSIIKFPLAFKDVIYYKDTLFIATYSGLYYRNGNDFLIHPLNFTKPINSIAISNNSLIIGTDGNGLYQYINGTITKLFDEVSFVEKVKVYNDSNILAATNKGLYSIKNTSHSIKLKSIYNINDGLKSNLVNDVILLNDKLYIATAKGITTIDYHVKQQQQLQYINVYRIKWNGVEIKDSIFKVKHNRNNTLEVFFSTINYTTKNYLNYSYKLSPSQASFIEIPNGQINLNNLPIGKHELTIKVRNDKNTVLEKTVPIIIEPNWHQTIWFRTLAVILFLLATFLIIKDFKKRISKKSEKKIKHEKQLSNFKLQALRSQMNPHFVFNSLNAIQYYINENNLEMSDKYLLKFSRLIRHFFDLSNETEISLNKEIELLSSYLEIEKMRFFDKLEYEIIIDPSLKDNDFKIPTMILQPLVENAVNHGVFHKKKGGKVTLEFNKLIDYSFEARIKDNGIGIKKSKELKANSIQGHNSKSTLIFKERVRLLNKSQKWSVDYEIKNLTEDETYPGTEVIIKFKRK